VPDIREPLLYRELSILEGSSKRMFPDLDDQTLAEISDLQGIGGSRDELRPREQLETDGVGPNESKRSSVS
jgi:hypothetical protein